jgi:hypothetical protein
MPEARPELRVEGRDDKWAIINLLICNGIDYDQRPWPSAYPEIRETDGVDAMLDGMAVAVQLSTGRPIGFVLDADSPLIDRWAAVRAHLASVGVDTPVVPHEDGFVGRSIAYGTSVGVWLMPDNVANGDLEGFLNRLISDRDPVIGHARTATERARELGAQFAQSALQKAVMHSWLAWQEEPGLPYGTAVRAHYFRHDHALVQRFVAWFRLLYGIPPGTQT